MLQSRKKAVFIGDIPVLDEAFRQHIIINQNISPLNNQSRMSIFNCQIPSRYGILRMVAHWRADVLDVSGIGTTTSMS